MYAEPAARAAALAAELPGSNRGLPGNIDGAYFGSDDYFGNNAVKTVVSSDDYRGNDAHLGTGPSFVSTCYSGGGNTAAGAHYGSQQLPLLAAELPAGICGLSGSIDGAYFGGNDYFGNNAYFGNNSYLGSAGSIGGGAFAGDTATGAYSGSEGRLSTERPLPLPEPRVSATAPTWAGGIHGDSSLDPFLNRPEDMPLRASSLVSAQERLHTAAAAGVPGFQHGSGLAPGKDGQPGEREPPRTPWHELLLHAPLYPERDAVERLPGAGRSPRHGRVAASSSEQIFSSQNRLSAGAAATRQVGLSLPPCLYFWPCQFL